MKSKFFIIITLGLIQIFNIQLCLADWSAKINAVGKLTKGQYKSSIIIGEGLMPEKLTAPPKAPKFSCYLSIKPLPDWSTSLAKDIRLKGQDYNQWVLAINPHGNIMSFEDEKAIISWDSSELGEGNFKLLGGWDGSEGILISDMKNVDSFEVTGDNEDQYYIIIQSMGDR